MSATLNRVFLIGNLTRDPEVRYIPSGTAVANFTLAVNTAYSTQSGEKKQEVAFIRILVWGRRAEVCGQYLSKGSPVFVEGRLRTRTWQAQDGQNRSTTEVLAASVQFLRGASSKGGDNAFSESGSSQDEVETIELGGAEGAASRNEKNNGIPQGNADDIPF